MSNIERPDETRKQATLEYRNDLLQLKSDLTTRLIERHGLSPDRAQQVVEDLEKLRPLVPQARLSIFNSDECREVIDLLISSGFSVSASPVSGIIEPHLWLGSRRYFGHRQIEDLVDKVLGRLIQGVPKEELLAGCY